MPDLGMSWKEALAYGEETSAKSHYIKDARLMTQQKYDLGRNSSWMFTKHGVPLQIRNMEKLKQFLDAGEQIHYQPVACYDGGDGSRTIQFFLNQIASDDAYKNVEVRTETRGVALLMSDERTVEGIQTKGADGLYVDISAKAVVLACGGMSNNLELLQNYSNQDLSHCVAVDQGTLVTAWSWLSKLRTGDARPSRFLACWAMWAVSTTSRSSALLQATTLVRFS